MFEVSIRFNEKVMSVTLDQIQQYLDDPRLEIVRERCTGVGLPDGALEDWEPDPPVTAQEVQDRHAEMKPPEPEENPLLRAIESVYMARWYAFVEAEHPDWGQSGVDGVEFIARLAGASHA